MDPLFPALPEDISSLTDDEINSHIDALLAIVEQVKNQDEAVLAGRDTASVVAELKAGVDSIKGLRAELKQREEIQAEAEAAIAQLTAEAVGTDPADETEEGETEEAKAAREATEAEAAAAAESEQQAIAASARTMPIRTRRREPEPENREVEPKRSGSMVASGGIDGFREGHEFTSRRELAEAIVAKRGNMIATPDGHEEKVRIARVNHVFDEARTLQVGSFEENWDKILSVVGPEAEGPSMRDPSKLAMVASGGLCAPVTPYYDLELVATTARPVRDALPVFNAQRGGIRYAPPPGLSTITNGVGYLTAAMDATGGTTGAKSCQHISCPSFTEVDVAMIYKCLGFGNLGSRAWPEQVTQFDGLASAAFAQLAERKLLDGISAASIHTTGAAFGGAAATILGQIETAAAGQRNRLRMDPEATLRLLAPAWLRDALVVDTVRSQFQRFEFTLADLQSWLTSINIAVSWYIDGTTTGGQVFGTQTAAALLPFPTTVQWFLFPEGSFIYLDAGTLDIGLVRDSTLNLSNDFQMFNEGFENIAFVGVESIQCISTFCANGVVTSPATAPSCAA